MASFPWMGMPLPIAIPFLLPSCALRASRPPVCALALTHPPPHRMALCTEAKLCARKQA